MPKSHVIIAGTGRAGTTFLMQLFTKLGLDTGFSETDFSSNIDPVSGGGLEVSFEGADFEKLSRVVKSPYFYKYADNILSDPEISIEHIFIPVRRLEDAAKSRIRVQKFSEEKKGTNISSDLVPGGLTNTNFKENQEVILGRQLTSLIQSVAKSDKPYSFLAFPRFAQNPRYLYDAISFLIPQTAFADFLTIFNEISDLRKIDNFQEQMNDVDDGLNYESLLNGISHDQYLFGVDDYMPSAWIGHAPFLKFVIRELRPKIFVELGVHNGFSYFVGCQAIRECGLSTRAYAVDHWEGDSQAGFYDDSVYQSVLINNSKYFDFSTLIKSSFFDALKTFKDGSIDLLHIDGFHSYQSVKEDFETWLPKMSNNGIILLHDIHVRRTSFGVFKFWKEIKDKFKTIEFVGSHGLGVVFLGDITTGNLFDLFEISESGDEAQIHGTFGSISDDVIQNFRIRDSAISERDSAISERDSAISERDSAISERDSAISERDLIMKSTIWKLTGPYRKSMIFLIKLFK
jgi:predicted O-methyltransferase YrrM